MDTQLRAITDPTRREILRQLGGGEQSAGAIARRFNVTRPAISHHLGVLRDAGLISMRRQAQSRLYSIDQAAVARLQSRLSAFWDDALPRLKSLVESEHPRQTNKNKQHG